ncbi:male sterility protein-domain-containing protein [Xylaria castorea]|nr:male sterility protein-domain-containing protein [Xylaria castorea]
MTANILSTPDSMALCNEGKPKTFTFISSTSVLDTDHYIKLSNEQARTGQGAIYESDDMQGSRRGLGTGYAQTKWVSEQLVCETGNRGLLGSVIRAGYVLGDMLTGVCNTDDFLIRMLKGCVQLAMRPRIANTVNAIPVNHVARLVVASALNPIADGVNVIQVTAHPRLRMNEYLSIIEYYGYKAPEKDHEQHALMPLFHFCMNDLPANTRAPELDDRNAAAVLKADAENWTGLDESFGHGISRDDVGRYLGYLAKIGFIGLPSEKGRPLPEILVDAQAVGGRRGAA